MVASNAFILTEMKEKAELKGREEGKEQGREEGKEQGAILARKEDILDNLKDIDTVPDDIIAIIDSQNDIEILKKWSKISARVDSIRAFKEKIKD